MGEKYKPEAGDRVRVVLEGEVRHVYDSPPIGAFEIGNTAYILPSDPAVVSIEKVEPPVETFKPGDVVRHRTGGFLYAVVRGGLVRLGHGPAGYTGIPSGHKISKALLYTPINSVYFERVTLS